MARIHRPLLVTLILAGASWAFSGSAVADGPVAGQNDAPVRLERCGVIHRSVPEDPLSGTRTDVVSGVSLRFVNVRTAAATHVTVWLRYQGRTELVTTSGSFETNVPIDRDVTIFTGDPYGSDSADCRLDAVMYADGATWAAHAPR